LVQGFYEVPNARYIFVVHLVGLQYTCLFQFNFGIQKTSFFSLYHFFPMDTNQTSIVYNGFVHVKHDFHHLKCDNLALNSFFMCFYIWAFHAWCLLVTQNHLFPLFLMFKNNNSNKYMVPKSHANIQFKLNLRWI